MSQKYTYTDEVHEKPFQKELFEVKTMPARDKLLMKFIGVGVDQLDKIYKQRKGPNPDVDKIILSTGNIKIYDGRNKEYSEFSLKEKSDFNKLSPVSQASINVLRDEYGVSYKPDIKYEEDSFSAKWSQASNDYEIRKLQSRLDEIAGMIGYAYRVGVGYDKLSVDTAYRIAKGEVMCDHNKGINDYCQPCGRIHNK